MSDENLLATLKAVAEASKELARVFRPGDIPVCNARVVRVNGKPWAKRVVIHPTKEGVQIYPLDPEKDPDPPPLGRILNL